MIIVLYDGLCGLCSKEIRYYQRIAPEGVFDWRDVARYPAAAADLGVSRVDALRELHARDAEGRDHVGVDAFILIWRQMKGWRRLAWVTALPGIRQVARFVYRKGAAWRFRRLDHCQLAMQEAANDPVAR